MSRCLITLKPLPDKNGNPRMIDREARALYGSARFSGRLEVDRQVLFTEGARHTKGFSISGVQQKLSMRYDADRNTLLSTRTNGTFILKPTPDQFAHCAELEHLGMLISRTFGIPTAQCGLIEFSNGEKAYITRRFDRYDGATSKRAMEDLCSLSDMTKEDKYDSSYEQAGLVLKAATGGKLAVMLDYFKRVVAAYVMGNEDLHLKNLSVIREPEDRNSYYQGLSPNYDCVPTMLWDMGLTSHMAMPLTEQERAGITSPAFDRFGYPTFAEFSSLGSALGLNDRTIITTLAAMEKQLPEALALVTAAPIPEPLQQKLRDQMERGMKAVLVRLESS